MLDHTTPNNFQPSATGSASANKSSDTCSSCGCPTEVSGTDEASGTPVDNRRGFLTLGAALLASGLSGCGKKTAQQKAKTGSPQTQTKRPKQGIDLEKWNRIKGKPYEEGAFGQMPGVCKLPGPNAKRNWPDRDKYKNTKLVPGMCQLCSTVCGIMGHVKDGRLIKIEGNPNDPNSRGHLCARGHAGLNHQYHPERLLYPLKRVGKRGEGKWKRISWDEALDEIAEKLKAIREAGEHEEFAFHQGRQRSKDCIGRFVKAFGTPTQLSHRSLCSGNRRAANLTFLWESDWDLNDVEHSKYILNFGSNAFEAHQGHVSFATRIQNGRFNNGAKMVTFDVRLSNTAGASDEWFAPFPGTDGAIALAMSHAILEAGLQSDEFINTWTNVTVDELKEHLKENTPEWAEKVSGVPAADIRRIAIEFAKAAPAATTMCNRGSSAHLNGFYNDRAIQMLNAVVGSVGKKGGWCWSPWGGVDPQFKAPAGPPSVKDKHSILEDPPEYPLANVWRRMRVGEIIYLYLLQGRAKLQAYMTYNLDSPLTWPEESLTQEVLSNEELIKFHVCINCFYNETAHYADIVLPWATYMERWDLEARGAYNLRPYVGIRTPMVEPLGEAKDIREFFPTLARKIGGGMEEYYKFDNVEDYMREWAKDIPKNEKTGKSGLDRLLEEGCYEDTSREPFYEPFAKELTAEELAGSNIEDLRKAQAQRERAGASPRQASPSEPQALASGLGTNSCTTTEEHSRLTDSTPSEPTHSTATEPNTPPDPRLAPTAQSKSNVITKDGKGIGILTADGKALRGFKTPSRLFEIRSSYVNKIGKNEDCSDLIAASGAKAKNRPAHHKGNDVDINEMPIYLQMPEHEGMADDELVMTSFKWNVHNHGRTMHLKWLAEIVHTNPAWMNPETARKFGLKDGDWIEITSYFPEMLRKEGHVSHGEPDDTGRLVSGNIRVPIVTMPGIHPKALAMSNSCGHTQYTNVAQAKKARPDGEKTAGMDSDTYRDADWERNMWWEAEDGLVPGAWKPNTGNGWNQNAAMPIAPDPITGQQAFHSTVVRVKSV